MITERSNAKEEEKWEFCFVNKRWFSCFLDKVEGQARWGPVWETSFLILCISRSLETKMGIVIRNLREIHSDTCSSLPLCPMGCVTPTPTAPQDCNWVWFISFFLHEMAKSLGQCKCSLPLQNTRMRVLSSKFPYAAHAMLSAVPGPTGIWKLLNLPISSLLVNAVPAIPNATSRWQSGLQKPFKTSLISKTILLMKLHPKLKQDTYIHTSIS